MKNKTKRISRILPAILAVMLCVTVFPVYDGHAVSLW